METWASMWQYPCVSQTQKWESSCQLEVHAIYYYKQFLLEWDCFSQYNLDFSTFGNSVKSLLCICFIFSFTRYHNRKKKRFYDNMNSSRIYITFFCFGGNKMKPRHETSIKWRLIFFSSKSKQNFVSYYSKTVLEFYFSTEHCDVVIINLQNQNCILGLGCHFPN